MKKVIREQSTKNPFVGKTVNFYKDTMNTKLLGRAKILSIKEKGDGDVEIDIDDKRENKFGRRIVFNCSRKGGGIEVTWSDSANRAVFFNKKFENELSKFYCVKNPKGMNVPKADYVSTDMGSSDMTEGKKIIRLTESDLVRLVKKVIKEQPTTKGMNSGFPYQNSIEGFNRYMTDKNWRFTHPMFKLETVKDGDKFILIDKKGKEPNRVYKFVSGSFREIENTDYYSPTTIKIYDDVHDTKLLDGVSVKGEGKKVGEDKTLEFQASKGSDNGLLRVSCFYDPPKFYFYKGSQVVLAGYNRKMGEQFCSRFGIKYRGPQKPEVY